MSIPIIKTVRIKTKDNLKKESLFLMINESKNSGKYFKNDFNDSLNFLEKRSNKNIIVINVGIIFVMEMGRIIRSEI